MSRTYVIAQEDGARRWSFQHPRLASYKIDSPPSAPHTLLGTPVSTARSHEYGTGCWAWLVALAGGEGHVMGGQASVVTARHLRDHSDELRQGHRPVRRARRQLQHRANILVSDALAQLCCHPLQILERQLP
eukprot:COSAG01_NODE_4694_length_4808_cov_1.762370_5_plen_132_part_00